MWNMARMTVTNNDNFNSDQFLYNMNISKNYMLNNQCWNKPKEVPSRLLPVFLNNFRLLKYEFPFLVLLRCFISSLVLPTQHLTAISTIDISNSMETSYQMPIFFSTYNNIHCVGEQKCSAISSL